MANICPDENPRLCQDYKVRKKLYDLLVYGGYISVTGKRTDGDRTIEIAKNMIIGHNRNCIASNCSNIQACTDAIEESSVISMPKGFFSPDVKPDKPLGILRNFAFSVMKRVFGKV